jgi:acylaminoacyl-peptidase
MKTIKLIFLLTLPFSMLAQDKLTLLDIYEMEFVSDPQISPDGSRILYVRNYKDVMTDKNLSNIWIIDFDGSNNQPVTTGNQTDNNPRWLSNDKILFKSNKSGHSHVYQFWLNSRAEQQITNLKNDVRNIVVSPDGTQLAFNMFVDHVKQQVIKMPAKPEGAKWNDPPKYIDDLNYRGDGQGYLRSGSRHLFIMPVSGGTPRQLTKGDQDYGAPVWAPNGQMLYFSANLHEDADYDTRNTEVYELSLPTGNIRPLTSRQGPDNNPVVSPDGGKIAYLGFDDRYQGYQMTRIYVMNADGSGKRSLSDKFDRNPGNLKWNDKGDRIYFQYTNQGVTNVASINMNGKVLDLASNVGGLSLGRPYSAGMYSITGSGRYAYTLGASDHPADLAAGEDGKFKRLTSFNNDILEYKRPGKVEEIWFESSFDKRKIQGWLVYPPDFDPKKKYPMILEIHGGPFASYSPWFAIEIQLYASAGYVVLYANPRGSTSYGEEFGNLIHHNYPGEDYDDLMSGVDKVLERGFIDENNLFVTGGSGGGVLSSWIIGKTDRFKAAVVAKPVINWYSFVLYADGPGFFYKYWFPGVPWENAEHYMKRSPISLVGNVTTPTMILTGEEDYRTPIAETEQYYAALKIQRVEAAMVRIPGASHGIANRPSNLVAKVAAILSWFDKYKDDSVTGKVGQN